MLSVPPAHRDPSESQGGDPTTTLSGKCAGALKCERNSSANIPSKSGGSLREVSWGATDILMTAEMESVACSVSRQAAALRAPVDRERGGVLVAQAATNTESATIFIEGRRTRAI